MLCDICKKNVAKVHLTQIVDGKTKKVDLCEACSKAKGVDDPTGFSLADLLLGLGAAQEMEQAASRTGLKCPSCGFSQADFKKTGRLGCPECYAAFAEGLETLLKTMHKGTQHSGKIPQSQVLSRDYEDRLQQLQDKLDKAVAKEDYEAAAVLRDQMTAIKTEFGNLKSS